MKNFQRTGYTVWAYFTFPTTVTTSLETTHGLYQDRLQNSRGFFSKSVKKNGKGRVIPPALMASESAHEFEGGGGYWVRAHSGSSNNTQVLSDLERHFLAVLVAWKNKVSKWPILKPFQFPSNIFIAWGQNITFTKLVFLYFRNSDSFTSSAGNVVSGKRILSRKLRQWSCLFLPSAKMAKDNIIN